MLFCISDAGEQAQGQQAQSDAPILAIAVGTPIQAVPPTQQTPPMAMAEPIVESDSEQGSTSRVEELGSVTETQAAEPEASTSK